MRITARHLWRAAAAVIVAGTAFYFLAPYNIAASLPHLPGVRYLLHGYMQNAVRIRARDLEPPAHMSLDDPALIRLGAGHFATGCAACHGAPGQELSVIPQGMRPAPPRLTGKHFTGPEYYWITLHGLKYTGMPAWSGEGRVQEPWALAAFLLAYDGLDPARYRDLAYVPSDSRPPGTATSLGGLTGGLTTREDCARCHGTDGLGREGTAPKLAGQSSEYLEETLAAYAEGRRESGIMEPVAAALAPGQREELARHYAGKAPPAWAGTRLEMGDARRGARLAREGDEKDEIPSCLSCHGSASEPPRKPETPRIAGQDMRWLIVWLHMWRDGPVPEGPEADRMHAAARPLSDDDITDLAAYFADPSAVTAAD